MIEDIKLPPLPYPYYTQAYRTTGEVIQDYARAAIKADRQRRGEPVQLCDCERGHNGIGIAVRECDCTGNNPHPSELVKEPEGWQLVPKKPTHEMLLAGKHTIKGADTTFEGILAEYAYLSMLEAAPKFGEEE